MEKKLIVKDLRISFRTVNGKVQAVRSISFDLMKGETLAIVGESGSGKSVTSRAILGILAGNAIVEGGEIIYDGKDLLKISEDDFHRIRGDKIAMIFQDPLSSLNPIMRIGQQLTEAMLLKNSANKSESKRKFKLSMELLLNNMNAAMAQEGHNKASLNAKRIKDFQDFEYVHIEHEQKYNVAFSESQNSLEDINNLLFEIEKNAVKDIVKSCAEITQEASRVFNRFVVEEGKTDLKEKIDMLKKAAKEAKKIKNNSGCVEILKDIKDILDQAVARPKPNFFSLGYYLKFVNPEIPTTEDTEEINNMTRKLLDEKFMMEFIAEAQKGIEHSFKVSIENKKKAIEVLKDKRSTFEHIVQPMKFYMQVAREMTFAVEKGINRLELIKDSNAYVFGSNLRSAINYYYVRMRKNITEANRFKKQTEKHDKLTAKGKTPDWTIVPADIIDLDDARDNILKIIDNLIAHYEQKILNEGNFDSYQGTIDLIDFFKEKASGSVYTVTPKMAKQTAIKLMEEVGIPEPRKRYRQYPFEFSGGMRQRIVIAIALAANPDILICDEPTTALDVTIQSQILELINNLKVERKLSVIFITHDLGVVANMADRIAVMYAGKIVEYGTAMEVFYGPRHPYTWALLSSMPDLDTKEKLEAIPGTPPNMIYPPKGDAFAQRNKYALNVDFEEEPPMFKITDTHYAATWLLHPDAPKLDIPKVITDRIARMKERGGMDDAKQ